MLQKDTIMFKNNWNKLVQDGFNVIFSYMKDINNKTPFQMKKEEALRQHDLVYEIMMSRYQEIRKLCSVNLEGQLRKYCENIIEESNNKITLDYFISKWISYSQILYDWIRKAFKSLDNVKRLITRESTLKDDVFAIYKEVIYNKSKDLLYQEFEQIVNEYRNNNQININLCKEYINFLKLFKENELIEKFISSTENYFNNLVQTHINSNFSTYMDFFWEEINKEKKFLDVVFPEEQKEALNRIYEVVYYKNFAKLLSASDGFLYMLNNYDNLDINKNNNIKEKLKYTFEIFISNENSFSMMTKLFKDFIKNNFKEKIILKEGFDKPDKKTLKPREILLKTDFIESYLKYQRNVNEIIVYCFLNNNIMNLIFKEGLVDIESTQDNANMTYVLPYFFDEGLTNLEGEEERKTQIDKGLEIFNFVPDKDIFVEIYRDLLSHRILNLYNKNYTDNKKHNFYLYLETTIIYNFTKECGNEYSSKLNNIISDYKLNENELSIKYISFINDEKNLYNNVNNLEENENKNDNNTSKKESQNTNINKDDIKNLLSIDTNIRIFSSENWPNNFNVSTALLPNDISSVTREVSKFYHKLYPGRILKFSLLNSYVLLNVNYSKILNNKTQLQFDIKCTTFQAIILLKFNEIYNKFNNKIKKEELLKNLQFESDKDFIKAILPLIGSKLIYEDSNGFYSLNNQLNVSNGQCLSFKSSEDTEIKKKEKQEIDRTYPVDGNIVKIVKQEKNITHKNLILKVLGALSNFSIKEEFIEKRISSLLEREIIFKNKKDPNVYIYNE